MMWLWAWGSLAHAEPRALTYEEALRSALENNPALRRARLDTDSASAAVRSARGHFDPTLSANGNWRSSRSRGFFQGFPFQSESRSWDLGTSVNGTLGTGTTYAFNASLDRNFSSFVTDFGVGSNEQIQDAYTSNLNVSLTQQLLKGFRTSFNLQNITRARQGLTTAELNLEKARQDALSQTATAYWNFAYQTRLREIADESVSVAKENLRIGELRLEAGQLAPVEGTRLRAALVQAETNALDALNASQQAADQLALLIGVGVGTELSPATTTGEVSVLDVDAMAAVDVALAQNLDLAIARSEADAAAMDAVNARHGRLPTLSATGAAGVGAQEDSAGAAVTGLTKEEAFPFVSIGGNFSVPLGNRAARGEAERAAVTEMQRNNAVRDLEASISSQVSQQLRVLESSRRRVALADTNLSLAEETLTAEEAKLEAGRGIQKDVLEARSEVDRNRAESAKARTDYRLARVELLRLQGQLTVDGS